MMENSFFEYRDATGVHSDSDSEVIDNSLDESFAPKKHALKNKTAFVAESEESSTDGDADNDCSNQKIRKSILRRSSLADTHVISSSDDDASKRGSIRRQSRTSSNKIVVSSSDEEEEEASPEMLPKRRPPTIPKSNSTESPCIRQKINKRLMLMESDMDNSIVIEHDKHRKLACLKDTPLKIDSGGKNQHRIIDSNDDVENDVEVESEKEVESDDNNDDKKHQRIIESDEEESIVRSVKKNQRRIIDSDEEVESDDRNVAKNQHRIIESDEEVESDDRNVSKNQHRIMESDEEEGSDSNDNGSKSGEEKANSDDGEVDDDDDEGPDEDQMLMSRATRMSIMGVIPKDNDSDDSDFIQSDDSHRKSCASSTSSLTELPDVSHTVLYRTPQKPPEPDNDSSVLTCSPFSNEHDLSNQGQTTQNESKILGHRDNICKEKFIDLTNQEVLKNVSKVLTVKNNFPVKGLMSKDVSTENKENYDDDITIIDNKPEIIALSSDDEDDVKAKSPTTKDVPKIKKEEIQPTAPKTMTKYLVPPSYPNQVVYVKKHVKDNELSKLEGLREDLQNVRNILENMDVTTLPDGGAKITQRLAALEAEVRRQGDKVANMVVEPDIPTAEDVARDGYDNKPAKGLSWDDIQKASNAVQPRMFGKQAMATHMAERNLILERLRSLHESLASRPPDSSQQPAPAAVRSQLMEHQLHALAWLRWRETQRPCGGILADDMGLGKTITMISLIMSDKENNIDGDDDDEGDHDRGSSKLSSGGSLVVCPASLMQQWAGEVSKHCRPHALSVCLHHGAQRATQPHRLAVHDLVVTTYNILQRDNEKNGVLMRVRWRRVILDEAHIVRNHKAATSVAVSALRGKRRWCLTGTPVQNKDLDLFALLKFLRCTPFDDLTMWKKWIDNKSQGGQDRLSTLMRAVLLRRTKAQLQQSGQLACLPSREAHQCTVQLATNEMNVYQKVLVFSKTLFAQFLHQRAEKQAGAEGFLGAGKDSAYDKMHKKMIALHGAKPVKSHEILVLLLRLRQVCCHCGLIAAMLDSEDGRVVEEDPAGQDLLAELNKLTLEDARPKQNDSKLEEEADADAEAGAEEGTSVAEAIRSVLSLNNPVFELTRRSSKIHAVMDCLQEHVFSNKEDKAVVVSQWTSVLKLVERELDRARVKSVTLSGSVPVPARPPLIEAINNPASNVRVMLLSLCAGGVGLNLCGANHLLLLDPHWNPQLEEQAQDRIYRVGQKKPVHIYRFMCVDTVEQTIRKLQQVKLDLADNVLTGAKNTNASKLTIEDLKMLFNMGQ